MRPVDVLVDKFVTEMNRRGVRAENGLVELIPLGDEDEAFKSLVTAMHDEPWCDWKIKPQDLSNKLATVEEQLGVHFPASFRSLVGRYAFYRFEAGPIQFWANSGTDHNEDWSVRVTFDKAMSPKLLESSFVQFATPPDINYDPICFHVRPGVKNREYPIVQIDHEEILCNDRIKVVSEIAPSFYKFLTQFLESEN